MEFIANHAQYRDDNCFPKAQNMPGVTKRRSAKTGLPPGSLIHIGQRHTEKAKVTLCEYDESHFQEREISTLEGMHPATSGEAVTWIHVDGLQEIGLLEQMGGIFCLHPLTLEDILNTEQRPKSEDHGDYLYIVLRLFHEGADGALTPEQVSIVLGPNWLISLQEKEGKLIAPVRERLRNEKGRMRKAGSTTLPMPSSTRSWTAILSSWTNSERKLKPWKMR
jgi:magnesium transporter